MGLEIRFDGACEPVNPGGIATYGYVIRKDGNIIASGRGEAIRGKQATNNYAEYYAALVALLTAYTKFPECTVVIAGDSQLVINQMAGKWRIKAQNLKPLYDSLKRIEGFFPAVSWKWVCREANQEADTLSKLAYTEASKA